MQNTTTQLRRTKKPFRKIYLSLYLKGLCVRGSWRPNRIATYWPQLLWPSALCLSRPPGLHNRRPGGPDFYWVMDFSTTSCHQQVWSPKTKWLPVLTKLYNSSIAHSISLEWHVWSSSSRNNCHAVHRSLSSGVSFYDCAMGFYLVPYCQPSPPTRFLPITAIGMCHFRRLGNGLFGRVKRHYTTVISSGCNALLYRSNNFWKAPMEVLLCEHVNDLRHSFFHLLNCLITTTSELREQPKVTGSKVCTIGKLRNCLDAHLGQIVCDKLWTCALSWWKCHWPDLKSAGLFPRNLFLNSLKTST